MPRTTRTGGNGGRRGPFPGALEQLSIWDRVEGVFDPLLLTGSEMQPPTGRSFHQEQGGGPHPLQRPEDPMSGLWLPGSPQPQTAAGTPLYIMGFTSMVKL